MQIKLDERLQAVANLIPPSITIGDIGTDHGYLLIDRISSGANPTGIGCDLRPGPLDSAKKNITLAGLNSQIELRLGDGLRPLHPSEVQWVTIAGMGGGTMKSILQESPIIWHSLEGLVCQPQSDGGELRKFLADSNWKIEKEELETVISISDTGIGMAEEELKNIWDRYYKVDPSRKNRKFGESGLGLPIVQQLVRLHKGHIDVTSELGKGTTFRIAFPNTECQETD